MYSLRDQRHIRAKSTIDLDVALRTLEEILCQVIKDGSRRASLEISHPPNAHDDIVYALALALYTTERTKEQTHTHKLATITREAAVPSP